MRITMVIYNTDCVRIAKRAVFTATEHIQRFEVSAIRFSSAPLLDSSNHDFETEAI